MSYELRRTTAHAHDGAILCAAYVNHARLLATGAHDGLIKCWHADSGDLVRTLTHHAGWVTDLLYVPKARALFACSADGCVSIWTSKGENIGSERPGAGDHTGAGRAGMGPLSCLAHDARRNLLLAGGFGVVWAFALDVDTADRARDQRLQMLRLVGMLSDDHGRPPHADGPVRKIISTDSGKVFTVGSDRQIRVWDTLHKVSSDAAAAARRRKPGYGESPLECVSTVSNCHSGAISACTYDPDNNWIITGSFDRRVRAWASDNKQIMQVGGFSDTLTGLCYVADTKMIWMCSNSVSPTIYDPRTATDVTAFLQQREPQLRPGGSVDRIQQLFYIRETHEIVATTSSRSLLVWRYNPLGPRSILRGHTDWAEALAYAPMRSPAASHAEAAAIDAVADHHQEFMLVSSGADSLLRRWHALSRMNPALYVENEASAGHDGAVVCVHYCAALNRFATAGDDGAIILWPSDYDLASQQPVIADGTPQATTAPTILAEHSDRITGLLSVGTTLVSVSWDTSLRLWDLARIGGADDDARLLESTHAVENAHDDIILSVAYSDELEQIATSSADGGVKLWDFTEDTQPTVDGGGGGDGARAAAAAADDAAAASKVLRGHSAPVRAILHLVEKRQYITAACDKTLRVWRAAAVADAVALDGSMTAGGMAAAVADDEFYELEEEPSGPTYADLHPLVEPRSLARGTQRGIRAGSNRRERDKGRATTRGAEDDATALTELEHRLMTLRTDLDASLARPPEPPRRRSLARRMSVASVRSQVSQDSSLLGGTVRTLLRSTGRKQGGIAEVGAAPARKVAVQRRV